MWVKYTCILVTRSQALLGPNFILILALLILALTYSYL